MLFIHQQLKRNDYPDAAKKISHSFSVKENELALRLKILWDGSKELDSFCGEHCPLRPNTKTVRKSGQDSKETVWGHTRMLFNTSVPRLYLKARNENGLRRL